MDFKTNLLNKIINTYVLGLQFFNLDDPIECYQLAQNFRHKCFELQMLNIDDSETKDALIGIAKLDETKAIISELKKKQLEFTLKSN